VKLVWWSIECFQYERAKMKLTWPPIEPHSLAFVTAQVVTSFSVTSLSYEIFFQVSVYFKIIIYLLITIFLIAM
jgi:hypothetical protein